jgi:broad specificity phosphatase PhoE
MTPAGGDVELYSSDLKRAQQTAEPISELLHAGLYSTAAYARSHTVSPTADLKPG